MKQQKTSEGKTPETKSQTNPPFPAGKDFQ